MKNLLFFWGLFMVVWALSCTTSYRLRQQDKKDEKIYKEATTNPRVAPRVAYDYNMLNPILQKTIYVKGKDSIIEVPVIVDRVKDSLILIACPSLNIDSLKRTLIKTITIIRVDTVIRPDTTCERRLYQSLANQSNLQGKYDQQKIDITQLKADNKTTQKKASKNFWWAVGGFGIFVLSWGFFIFKKAKSQFPHLDPNNITK